MLTTPLSRRRWLVLRAVRGRVRAPVATVSVAPLFDLVLELLEPLQLLRIGRALSRAAPLNSRVPREHILGERLGLRHNVGMC